MAEAKRVETVIQRFPTTAAVLRGYNPYVVGGQYYCTGGTSNRSSFYTDEAQS